MVIRAKEVPVAAGTERSDTKELKGALGGKKGECKATALLVSFQAMQGALLKTKLTVDNAKSDKNVIGVEWKLNRELRAYGKNGQGQDVMFEDLQTIAKGNWKWDIPAKDAAPKSQEFDAQVSTTKGLESNRVMVMGSMDNGQELCDVSKQLQLEVLPTVDTTLIKNIYKLVIQVQMKALVVSQMEGPKLEMPCLITRSVEGLVPLNQPKEVQINTSAPGV